MFSNTDKPEFQIGKRVIGYNYPPFIIAEIGINHGGDIKIAKKMVDSAARAGAECVKHQTHVVEDEMSKEAKKIIPQNANISIYDIMKSCSLNEEEEIELKRYVESKGMIFISTPFSRAAADRLNRMGVQGFKIGSGECNNLPLLNHIASFRKPIIMSTGMNSIASIRKSVEVLKKHDVPYALLHTTNLYPTPNKLVRLGAMSEMSINFPGVPFGLSDHTVTNHACFGAVALGASILERHFTDRMDRVGPDIICSMDEMSCKELIDGSRIIFEQRGGEKKPLKEEQVTIDFAFATVVSTEDIEKGSILSTKNIWVKRPGTGQIYAEHFNSLIGKTVNKNIKKDTHLSWEDFN
jgi:sialic acid synthase SpsE